ncbi:HIT domain-containing protein [Chromobacterium sp. IRSSSOUMB001]|uniref:HIT family protein n=1 Tax=Chromobacterium sp. IRSSSOUMB001 TaxID=2927123 RepID=UPI0020BD739E|nr:HIT domain-containing protein [Chromobacterium sp. IRSSSOUMB001]
MIQPNRTVMSLCPFCSLSPDRHLFANTYGVVIRDGFPISPGHTLIIPRRHIASFFALEPAEREGLMVLLDQARQQLLAELKPDGFNIGINDGTAAGQTVPHLHIHLIPRFAGDREDSRGGVRWIIPEKADYWSPR